MFEELSSNLSPDRDPYSLVAPLYDLLTEPFIRHFKRDARNLLTGVARTTRLRILEVAAGTGTQALMLAKSGHSVYALDKSPGMLAKGREKAVRNRSLKLTPIQGEAELLPFPAASFDAIVMQLTLHEMDPGHRDRAMREMKRVARDSAWFLFVDFAPAPRFSLFEPALALAERSMGKRHYKNSREFIREGGLVSFLDRHDVKMLRSRTYFGGLIMLALGQRNGAR